MSVIVTLIEHLGRSSAFLLIIAATTVALGVRYLIYPVLWGPYSHIPGPWFNKVGALSLRWYDLCLNRNENVFRWHQQYGPVVCIAPGEVSVATLKDTHTIYSARSRFEKSNYFEHFIQYGARSVFATKAHSEHSQRRKLTSAFYHASNIYKNKAIEDWIRSQALEALCYIDKQCNSATGLAEVDVYSLSDWYAMDNITYLILGSEHCTQTLQSDCQERQILRDLKSLQLWGPFRLIFPLIFTFARRLLVGLSSRYNYLHAESQLSEWILAKVQMTQQDLAVSGSEFLMQRLLEMSEKNETIDRSFVNAEILDNINAAEATVCVTTAYLFWCLAENPFWQHQVRQELSQLHRRRNEFPSFAEIDSLHALEACLREVYRLYPANSGRSERVVPSGGCVLADHYIPCKTIVTASIPSLHRDPELFPAAHIFDPSRWLIGDEMSLKKRMNQLLPFGYGERVCLGIALANMEIKLFTAALCLQYELFPNKSSTAQAMQQMSTHDAVPRSLQCILMFKSIDTSAPTAQPGS